jgi:hypothetical protein
LPGILTLILLVGAIGSLSLFKKYRSEIRSYAFWSSFLLSLILGTVTLYTATFEFEEHPETLTFSGLPEGEPSCGTGWTYWTKGGYGTGNPCPKGCYRGLTLRKQMSMSGFPPWPDYRRELQCWTLEE